MGHLAIRDMPSIVMNRKVIYEGDLEHYLRLVEVNMPDNGYHNPQHIFNVVSFAHAAGEYYLKRGKLNRQQIRWLLVAAMMHDWGHLGRNVDKAGQTIDDSVNIKIAIDGLHEHAAEEDRQNLEED